MAEKNSPHAQNHNFDEFNTPVSDEARELLEKIEQSHKMRYKMMNLETWSLAKTMDTFLPGFWNRFLENRRTAMKQFIEQRRKMRGSDDELLDSDGLSDSEELLDNLTPDSDDSPQEMMHDRPPEELQEEHI